MKKAARVLLICLGVLAVLLTVAIIAAFQPSVQTWAARKVAASQPGMEITIGRVAAGLNKIELTGIRVKSPAGAVDLPSATVEMSLLGAIREKIDIKKLVAKGWTVDLSAAQPSPAAQPAAAPPSQPQPKNVQPSGGLFDMLKLPVDLSLDAADIQGTVILPPEKPGQPAARANISLRGGGLRAGSDGKFDLAADVAMPASDALVSNIQIRSALAARMDTPRSVQSLNFDADARASGGQLPQGARLKAAVAASRSTGGEDYAVSVKTEASGVEKTLFSIKAANPAGADGLSATWIVDALDSDLKPFVQGLGLGLPAFAAKGQGTLSANDSFENIRAGGKLTADVSNLGVIDPALAALGRINFKTDFDVVREGDIVRVSALSADIASADAPVATVKALQLIELNTAKGEIKVPDAQADLVRVDIHGVPLAWAQAFINDTGLAVTGGPLRGSLTVRAQGSGFSVRSVAPFTLAGLSVSQNKQPLAAALDISAGFAADYAGGGLGATVSDFSIRSAGRALVESPSVKVALEAAPEGSQAPVSAMGRARIDIAALMAQPAAADFRMLSGGAADIEFSGRLDEKLKKIAAKITASGLKTNDQKDLPKVTADVRADLYADGRGDVQAPLVFELNSRKSDIDLTASLKLDGARQNIDASVSSNEIYIEDMMAFSALAPAQTQTAAPAPAPQTPAPAPTTPGTTAPWDGITGQLKFLLKKVVYSADVQAANVSGAVKITPSLLSLENLRAVTGDGGEVKAGGSLKFDANAAAASGAAYATDAKLVVTNFDPAPVLVAMNPGKKPTVEGKFDINGSVSGTSASLADIASGIGADLTLVSRGGKFHGFETSAAAANLGKVQKAASTVATIGGALLSALGKNDNAAIADKIRAGSDIVGRLIDMNFDQMNIEAAYRAGKETVIKNFSILSPDMRLTSSGSFGNDSTLSWAKQAVKLVAQMSVRGDQAKDLSVLGLLKKEADSLGFTPLLENFPIEGTASSLTTDALFKQISAKLSAK